jgi:hypothetical protein
LEKADSFWPLQSMSQLLQLKIETSESFGDLGEVMNPYESI